MKLNVPLLGQRDPRWANLFLGTSNVTIGGFGCLLTCSAMLLQYEKTNYIDPNTLNNWLILNGGYASGDLLVWSAISLLNPAVQVLDTISCGFTPAPLSLIKQNLDNGDPVILGVSFNKDPNLHQPDHFVIAVGYDDQGTLIINDPWYNDQVFFIARYGDPAQFILQVNQFQGGIKDFVNQVSPPPVENPAITIPVTNPTPIIASQELPSVPSEDSSGAGMPDPPSPQPTTQPPIPSATEPDAIIGSETQVQDQNNVSSLQEQPLPEATSPKTDPISPSVAKSSTTLPPKNRFLAFLVYLWHLFVVGF